MQHHRNDGEIPWFAVGVGPVDAKFIGDAPWNDTGGPEGVPDHYTCQSQWQQHVTGADAGILVAIHTAFGRRSFRIYRLPRNQAVIDSLVTIVDDFWNRYVVPKVIPPVDGTEAASDAIKLLWPRNDPGKTVEIDAGLHAEVVAAQAEVKAAEARARVAAQRVQEAMGDADTALALYRALAEEEGPPGGEQVGMK
jgi:predicted phage-related endonuclease